MEPAPPDTSSPETELVSRDRSTLYVVKASGGETAVLALEASTRTTLRTLALDGIWEPSTVAADGSVTGLGGRTQQSCRRRPTPVTRVSPSSTPASRPSRDRRAQRPVRPGRGGHGRDCFLLRYANEVGRAVRHRRLRRPRGSPLRAARRQAKPGREDAGPGARPSHEPGRGLGLHALRRRSRLRPRAPAHACRRRDGLHRPGRASAEDARRRPALDPDPQRTARCSPPRTPSPASTRPSTSPTSLRSPERAARRLRAAAPRGCLDSSRSGSTRR